MPRLTAEIRWCDSAPLQLRITLKSLLEHVGGDPLDRLTIDAILAHLLDRLAQRVHALTDQLTGFSEEPSPGPLFTQSGALARLPQTQDEIKAAAKRFPVMTARGRQLVGRQHAQPRSTEMSATFEEVAHVADRLSVFGLRFVDSATSLVTTCHAEMTTPIGRGMICRHCSSELTGRVRSYCDRRCYMRAYRRRLAGVPEKAFPDGGLRGPTALNQLTINETTFVRLLDEELHELADSIRQEA